MIKTDHVAEIAGAVWWPCSGLNCAGRFWLPWYFGSDIWFQDVIWEAFSLGFQSSLSTTWSSWESPGEYSMIDRFLREVFAVWSRPFWSTILQCSDRLPIHTWKLLGRVVSVTRFLTGGVFEGDLAHRQSVAVLCMPYKIRCNRMHPLYGALPVPYVPVRATRGRCYGLASVYSCGISQYSITFIILSVSFTERIAAFCVCI